jgi:hypothetical protein
MLSLNSRRWLEYPLARAWLIMETVVWKSKTARILNIYDVPMDKIDAMTYEDFVANLATMRIADDDEIFFCHSE